MNIFEEVSSIYYVIEGENRIVRVQAGAEWMEREMMVLDKLAGWGIVFCGAVLIVIAFVISRAKSK